MDGRSHALSREIPGMDRSGNSYGFGRARRDHHRQGERPGRRSLPRRVRAGAEHQDSHHRLTYSPARTAATTSRACSAGEYNLRIRAVGYRSDPHQAVALTGGQKASFDWTLQSAPVRWTDLSFYQGDHLMPAGRGRLLLEQHCLECHCVSNEMAGVSRDEEGWSKAVNYMLDVMGYRLTALSDEDATVVKGYLTSVFGQDSKLPRDVRDMPEYKNLVRPSFADEAMKIVYVTYELPGPNRMPFSAAPDKDGYFWIPYFSMSDSIGRLDPKTGEVQEFRVPYQGAATIHSAVPAPDRTVWLAEQGSNRLGKWDPATKQITEYPDTNLLFFPWTVRRQQAYRS